MYLLASLGSPWFWGESYPKKQIFSNQKQGSLGCRSVFFSLGNDGIVHCTNHYTNSSLPNQLMKSCPVKTTRFSSSVVLLFIISLPKKNNNLLYGPQKTRTKIIITNIPQSHPSSKPISKALLWPGLLVVLMFAAILETPLIAVFSLPLFTLAAPRFGSVGWNRPPEVSCFPTDPRKCKLRDRCC